MPVAASGCGYKGEAALEGDETSKVGGGVDEGSLDPSSRGVMDAEESAGGLKSGDSMPVAENFKAIGVEGA